MRTSSICILMLCGLLSSCAGKLDVSGTIPGQPDIYPDYRGVTVPQNIAPMNFSYMGEDPAVLLVDGRGGEMVVKGRHGLFRFGSRKWRHLMEENVGCDISLTVAVRQDGSWRTCDSFNITVSADKVDPYLSYRLIPPGYQGWKRMGIYQRNLENYRQRIIADNSLSGENCVNCHTYCSRNPDKMLFHARAEFGGTFFFDGKEIEKLNTKTDSTISALVYPYWHPSGKYVTFSVNATRQSFFNHDPNRIEVFDTASDVVVYDVASHNIFWSPLTRSAEMFQTFPTFSPDGKWLYFCGCSPVGNMPDGYAEAHYGIYRIAFNPEYKTFGDSLECLYDGEAEGKSASFPRISPDGRYLVFTKHGYGNFSIWHKDADLWVIDLSDGSLHSLATANSDDVDSYHSWSGNSRWLVFSSRRDDGLYTRPYITHIDEDGNESKPFMLPQRNPRRFYKDLMVSYNLPEFMEGPVRVSPHRISTVMRKGKATDVTPVQ